MIVFVTGLSKLWWTTRRNRKEEIKDQEKRERIQELRKSGLLVESQGGCEIPFGVRALESGMEIDGIWVSRSTTPIPEGLRDLRGSVNSFSRPLGSRGISFSSDSTYPIPPGTNLSLSRQSKGPHPGSSEISPTLCHSRDPSGSLSAAYKPRYSSQLRISSYGDMLFHEDTLSKLQGTQRRSTAQNCDVPSHTTISANSSSSSSAVTAENERCSISLSDSEGTMPHKMPKDRSQELQWASDGAEHTISKGKGTSSAENSNYTSRSYIRKSKGDYIPVRPGSPQEISNPFITPNASPVLDPTSGIAIQGSRNESHLLESQWPLLSQEYLESSEQRLGVGDIHANKSVRKVNSGFEVLPAGTFGIPPESFSGTSEDPYITGQSQANNKRKSIRKLQKKPRNSSTGGRISKIIQSS